MEKRKKSRKGPEVQDLLRLHLDSWGRLAKLIAICTKQRDAGVIKVARQAFTHAQRLRDEIAVLEELVAPKQR